MQMCVCVTLFVFPSLSFSLSLSPSLFVSVCLAGIQKRPVSFAGALLSWRVCVSVFSRAGVHRFLPLLQRWLLSIPRLAMSSSCVCVCTGSSSTTTTTIFPPPSLFFFSSSLWLPSPFLPPCIRQRRREREALLMCAMQLPPSACFSPLRLYCLPTLLPFITLPSFSLFPSSPAHSHPLILLSPSHF